MNEIERALATEELARLAVLLAGDNQELLIGRDRPETSQFYRAVQLAGEEGGRQKVADLARHQASRSTMKEGYRKFWDLLRKLATGENLAVREYLGDRQVLEDWEFRRLVEFLVTEFLYQRAGMAESPGNRRGRR